jgi:cell wall-associated NlpC family hydrolase
MGNTSCIHPPDYVSALKRYRGLSYWRLSCTSYITTAKNFHHPCNAKQFWSNGCDGALLTVSEAPRFQDLNRAVLQPGDVIAFHGVHVAAYLGDGEFMDSDPTHAGVGTMTPVAGDAWFTGAVKVLRWRL